MFGIKEIKSKGIEEIPLNQKSFEIKKINYLTKPTITGESMSTSILEKIAIFIFKPLLGIISEPIKKEVEKFVKDMYVKAKNTESPLDDLFIKLVATVLSIDLGE